MVVQRVERGSSEEVTAGFEDPLTFLEKKNVRTEYLRRVALRGDK